MWWVLVQSEKSNRSTFCLKSAEKKKLHFPPFSVEVCHTTPRALPQSFLILKPDINSAVFFTVFMFPDVWRVVLFSMTTHFLFSDGNINKCSQNKWDFAGCYRQIHVRSTSFKRGGEAMPKPTISEMPHSFACSSEPYSSILVHKHWKHMLDPSHGREINT